jgi:ribosomal protein L40E
MAGRAVEPDDEAAAIEQMISDGAPDLPPPAVPVRRMSHVCAECGALKSRSAARCGTCGIRNRLDVRAEPSAMRGRPNGARRSVFFARIASLWTFERRVDGTRTARSLPRLRRHDARGAAAD